MQQILKLNLIKKKEVLKQGCKLRGQEKKKNQNPAAATTRRYLHQRSSSCLSFSVTKGFSSYKRSSHELKTFSHVSSLDLALISKLPYFKS